MSEVKSDEFLKETGDIKTITKECISTIQDMVKNI